MCTYEVRLVFVGNGEPIDAVDGVDGGGKLVVEYLAGGERGGVDVGS